LHCGSDCSKTAAQKDMPLDDFLKSIEPLRTYYTKDSITVAITGGEPLLRGDLDLCGKELRKRGFRWGIVTNGFAYDEAMHGKLAGAGMGSLTLSIDGMEESHNWLRNHKNSYSKAIDALQLIKDSKRINYDVVTCVNKRNITELNDIKKYFVDNKVKTWRLFTISPIGRAANNTELQLDATQFKYLMEFIASSRKEKKLDVKFSCESFVGPYEKKVRDGYFFCRAGINIASVLIDGSISACPNIDRSFVQGNIYADDLLQTWNQKFTEMRNRTWTKTGMCSNCNEYKWCQGGGLHFWQGNREQIQQCHCWALNNN
jgi:radical SAM enzyme (rSAM/lipoprotein system)